MGKGDVLKRQAEKLAEKSQAESNAAQRQLNADGEKARLRQPCIILTAEAAWFNEAQVHKLVGGGRGRDELLGKRVKGTLSWKAIADGAGRVREMVSARELEMLLDSGQLGLQRMGLLEIFRIVALGDLTHYEAVEFGFERLVGGAKMVGNTSSLSPYFEEARLLMIGGAPGGTAECDFWGAGELHGVSWAAVDGEPAKGPVGSLIETLPLEIGFDHRGGTTVYLRSLKRDPEAMAEWTQRQLAAKAGAVEQLAEEVVGLEGLTGKERIRVARDMEAAVQAIQGVAEKIDAARLAKVLKTKAAEARKAAEAGAPAPEDNADVDQAEELKAQHEVEGTATGIPEVELDPDGEDRDAPSAEPEERVQARKREQDRADRQD